MQTATSHSTPIYAEQRSIKRVLVLAGANYLGLFLLVANAAPQAALIGMCLVNVYLGIRIYLIKRPWKLVRHAGGS